MKFDSNFDKEFLKIPKTVFPKVLSENINHLLSSGVFLPPLEELIKERANNLGIKVSTSSWFNRSSDKFKITFMDNTVHINSGIRSEFIAIYLSIGISILSAFKSDAMTLLGPSTDFTWSIGLGDVVHHLVPFLEDHFRTDSDLPPHLLHLFSEGVTHLEIWRTREWKKNEYGVLDPVSGSLLLPILGPVIKHSISEMFSGLAGATLQLLISDTEFWETRGDLRREFISKYFGIPKTYTDILLWHLHKIHRYPTYSANPVAYTEEG